MNSRQNEQKTQNSDNITKLIVITIFLLIFSSICISSYIQKSPTCDEIQHLSCGYAILQTGNFYIAPEHPPLSRILTALPFLLIKPNYPKNHPVLTRNPKTERYWWQVNLENDFGDVFFYQSQNNPDILFFWGRFVSVLLSCLLGIIVYTFSTRMYGIKAGLFSLFLYVFSPTIIAHSRLTNNDVNGALGILLTLFTYLKYAEDNSIKNLILMSVCCGIALLIKFNAILLVIFILIGIIFIDKKKFLLKYGILLTIIILMINATYCFSGTFELKSINYKIFQMLFPIDQFDQIAYWIYQYLPLPDAYLRSLATLFIHITTGHPSFIMGRISDSGVWYYFPVAFLLKTPLLTLAFSVLWMYQIFKSKKLSKGEEILISFFLFYFVFSIRSTLNLGLRHILPLYPIMFILLGRLCVEFRNFNGKKTIKYLLPVIYIISTQYYFPHYLPFFNCLTRPENGYKYLVDSNLDWGQDLPKLKKYLIKQNNPSLLFSYFGTASTNFYEIDHQSIVIGATDVINPYDVKKELLAVSATHVQGLYFKYNIFEWLEKREPIKKIGYSIFIYDISDDPESIANIGEIYRSIGKTEHALRQYKRLLYLEPKGKYAEWAHNKINLINYDQQ